MLKTFWFLLAGVTAVMGLFEGSPHVEKSNPASILKQSQLAENTIFSITYEEKGQNSILLENSLLNLFPKFSQYEKFFKFFAIDCSSSPDCKKNPPVLPYLEAYVPTKDFFTGKVRMIEYDFQGEFNEQELEEFIEASLPFLGKHVTSMEDVFWSSIESDKIIYVTKSSKIPLFFKEVSVKFNEHFDIGIVNANNADMVEKLEVQEIPCLMFIRKGKLYQYTEGRGLKEIEKLLGEFEGLETQEKKVEESKREEKEEGEDEDEEGLVSPEDMDLRQMVPMIPILSLRQNNFEKVLEKTRGPVLVHFSKNEPHKQWTDIKKIYNGIVRIAEVSCLASDSEKFCEAQGAVVFPSLRIYPSDRSASSEYLFKGFADLDKELEKQLRPTIVKYDPSSFEQFILDERAQNHIICVYIGTSSPSLAFQSVASNKVLQNFVEFAHLPITEGESSEFFMLSQYPSVISFFRNAKTSEIAGFEYNHDTRDYRALLSFVMYDNLPVFLKQRPKLIPEDMAKVEMVKSKEKFEENCFGKFEACVIGLMKRNNKNFQVYGVMQYVKNLMMKRGVSMSFLWIDADCQSGVMKKLGIGQRGLPGLAVFGAGGKKAARLHAKFNLENTLNLVDGWLLESVETFEVNELEFDDSCKKDKDSDGDHQDL